MASFNKLFLIGSVAAMFLHPSIECQAQESAVVALILGDWRAKKDRYKSIKYTISGQRETKEATIPPELSLESKKVILPKFPQTRPVSYEVLIDFEGGRWRIEKNEESFSPAKGRWVPTVTTSAYDRNAFQEYIPREINELSPSDPEMALSKGDLRQVHVEAQLWPVFYAHGLVPTVSSPLRPDKWPTKHESEDFILQGEASQAGQRCVVLRTEPSPSTPSLKDEFWIAQKSESTIVRHVYYQGKNPWYLIDVKSQQRDGGWLPESWQLTHSKGGRVQRIFRLAVTSTEANPKVSDTDFTLPIKPGMLVISADYPGPGSGLNPSYPAHTKYRAGEGGSKELVESVGFTTMEGIQLPPESGSRRWIWWVAGGAVVAALGLLFRRMAVRRRRANRVG